MNNSNIEYVHNIIIYWIITLPRWMNIEFLSFTRARARARVHWRRRGGIQSPCVCNFNFGPNAINALAFNSTIWSIFKNKNKK